MFSSRSLVVAISLAGALTACGTTAPQVKVLGVSEAKSTPTAQSSRVLYVYVQVVNPTKRDIELSRLEYAMNAESWFSTNGKVTLRRRVGADAATVLEIPIPYTEPEGTHSKVQYRLSGRLFARDARDERSWKVNATGYIEPSPTGSTSRIQFRVAATRD